MSQVYAYICDCRYSGLRRWKCLSLQSIPCLAMGNYSCYVNVSWNSKTKALINLNINKGRIYINKNDTHRQTSRETNTVKCKKIELERNG